MSVFAQWYWRCTKCDEKSIIGYYDEEEAIWALSNHESECNGKHES